MLSMFRIERTFNDLTMSLHVDATAKEATGMIVYDRRIVGMMRPADVPYADVSTPEKAEAWLSRPIGERGSLVETMEWRARTGQMQIA